MQPGPSGGGGDRRLLRIYRSLDADNRRTLVAFAEFLAARQDAAKPAEVEAPRPEPRPPGERVVAAIKRLSRTYPMLAQDSGILNEVSSLMAGHVLHGRAPDAVIDDLEALFSRTYADYRTHANRQP
jgi:hypothetical protein